MRIALAGLAIVTLSLAGVAIAAPVGPPAPVKPRSTPAQQSIALYRDQYAHWRFKPCPPSRPGEVVVCGTGRGGSADRLPLPDERGPPAVRVATGQLPSAAEALATTADGSCRAAHCPATGAIDLIGAAVGGVRLVRALVDPEGASDSADRQHPWRR